MSWLARPTTAVERVRARETDSQAEYTYTVCLDDDCFEEDTPRGAVLIQRALALEARIE